MLRIKATRVGRQGVLLKVEGHLVGGSARVLEQHCRERLDEGQEIVLDLSQIRYVNARGVEVMRRLMERRIRIVSSSPLLTDMLRDSP